MRKSKNLMYLSLRVCLTMLLMFLTINLCAQNVTIRGSVKDVKGEPIIGCNVHVSGTTNGMITDVNGNFTIKCSPKSVLDFSYIGYEKKIVPVGGRKVVDVVLNEEAHSLDEVVVTAMGIKKDAKKLGYAVSNISSDEIVKAGASNFATAIYGKASGVSIQAAPGGNTSSVSITIRGLSSITGTTQPLIILDGVPIRNGDANNSDYWDEPRVYSNGLIDINPDDIANISILKGAAASALYGSEAANGVVMITTKTGKNQKGVGVNVSMNLDMQKVAYMPEIQTEFGPGDANYQWQTDYEKSSGGFYQRMVDGNAVKSFNTVSYQWGPKYDGSEVYYYDGTYRKYSPIKHNQWDDVFRTGFDQTYNISITQGGEKNSMRFSYTFNKSIPTQYNSDNYKHNFSLTGSYNLDKALKFDYSVNYMRQHVKNRTYRINRLICNYGGMFGSFDDIRLLRKKTVTSQGYEAAYGSESYETPDENFAFQPFPWSLVDEYFWNIYGKEQLENNNRLIASIQPSWKIVKGLTLRGHLATDMTANDIELEERNQRSLAFENGGSYSLTNDKYEIYYGDAMLMFDRDLTSKLNLSTYIGWSGRQEQERQSTVATSGGLSVVNWFNLAASVETPDASMYKMNLLKTAFFGDITLGWDDWAFLEGTAREEKTSTLAKGHNSYFYPSVNGSLILSELMKDHKPSWLDYGKVRVSYGIVGNAPGVYSANNAYNQSSVSVGSSSFIYDTVPSDLGNENIKPETTYEWEFGLEGKFLRNRLGFELSYYDKLIKDQILQSTTPYASGAGSILLNIGELTNKGYEFAAYGTPVQTKDWRWDLSGNISHNTNKVKKLMPGVDKLLHYESDSSVQLISDVGKPMGDWYVYTFKRNDNGNLIISDDGIPIPDKTEMHKVGNAMPKLVGGLSSSLSYKNFSLSVTCDFRLGGDVWNPGWQYMMEIGNIKDTLHGREGHGGIDYYYANNDFTTHAIAGTAPSNATQFHDGMILDGVTTSGTKNTQVIPAAEYYNNAFGWGSYANQSYEQSIQKNSYFKLRELTFAYTLPTALSRKVSCKRLTVSVYGRNLFYFYKTLKDMDAEAADGTTWISQAVINGSTATTRTFGFSLRASF